MNGAGMRSIALAIAFFGINCANAATFEAETTEELRAALEAAALAGGDNTIQLASGTFSTQADGLGVFSFVSNQGGSLTIRGSSDAESILDGDNTDRILRIHAVETMSLTIESLSFSNGYLTLDPFDTVIGGAALQVVGEYALSALVIRDSKFSNNQAIDAESNQGRGGAIYYWGLGLEIENSEFDANRSGVGGAIYAPSLRITNTTFTNNRGDTEQAWHGQTGGGAISGLNNYALSIIKDSRFIGNTAAAKGGAINWRTSEGGELIRNTFLNNEAGDSGGAVGTSNSLESLIAYNTFSGNRSLEGGGALHLGGSPFVDIVSNIFEDNFSETNSAGVYVDHAGYGGSFAVYITNNLFRQTKLSLGYWESPVRIANNIFIGNQTDLSFYSADSVAYVYNNYIDISRLTGMVLFEGGNVFEDVNLGFLDGDNGDYRLLLGSGLIEAGTMDPDFALLSEEDKAGLDRVTGDTVDIGPYEYNVNNLPKHSVTSSASDGGSIDPSGVQLVPTGISTAFTVFADNEFVLEVVAGTCGGSIEGDVYTTEPIAGDCTVTATFVTVIPAVPEEVRAEGGDREIYVRFAEGIGGSVATGFTVTCTDGTNTYTGTSTSSPITVSGLTNDVAYTCSVTATNSVGTSSASAATAPITPEEQVGGLPIWLLYQATQ